jgi:proteic killer suppression protein
MRRRAGQHSIRINEQFCVRLVWRNGNAFDAGIVDYH